MKDAEALTQTIKEFEALGMSPKVARLYGRLSLVHKLTRKQWREICTVLDEELK